MPCSSMTLAASMESSPPEISATALRGVPVAGAARAGAIEVAGSGCWDDMENTVNESGGGDTSPNDAFGHAPRSRRITCAKKRALAGPFCYAGLRWTGFFLRGDSGEARSTPGHYRNPCHL